MSDVLDPDALIAPQEIESGAHARRDARMRLLWAEYEEALRIDPELTVELATYAGGIARGEHQAPLAADAASRIREEYARSRR